MSITSESFGIVGSTIDFQQDLGLTKTRFRELHLVFHPGRKHKFRFQYIPLDYNQTATLKREIVFNGQRYSVGLPVISELDWKAYSFGYEYDFISTRRGFGGVLLDLKQTARARLAQIRCLNSTSPPIAVRRCLPSAESRASILVPSVSITGELSADQGSGEHQLRFQGTLHRARHLRHVELQPEYRRAAGISIARCRRRHRQGSGSFTVKGLYFGIVARY